MRVLFNAVSAKVGGAVTYINAVARELAASDQHEFIFIVPKQLAANIHGISARFQVIASDVGYTSAVQRFWFDQVGLPRIIRRERIDVLFSTANFATLRCPCRQVLL